MRLTAKEYEKLIEFSPNLVWRTQADGRFDYFNKTWLQFTGRSLAQERDEGWHESVHPEDIDRYRKIFQAALEGRKPFQIDYRHRRHDGQWRWTHSRGAPLHDEEGEFVGFSGISLDITERYEREQSKDLALLDGLTGFYKRRYFEQRVEEEMKRAGRDRTSFSIILVDIDNFRAINEKYTHKAGNKVIKGVSQIIRENIRGYDIPARIGGDEFGVVLPEISRKEAINVAERLRHLIEAAVVSFDRKPIEATGSLAVVQFNNEVDAAQLIHKAGRLMFDATNGGGNLVKAA